MPNSHPLAKINFTESAQAYIIEASAGTGKTWTIERLFIKALLEASINNDANIPIAVENILVVTFTNDATDELKQRISNQLQITINQILYIKHNFNNLDNNDVFINYLYNRQQEFDYKKDINILTRAYQNFDAASIYTIHGFCNKILNDYQFECNINAKFELVTDKLDLIEELTRDFIRSKIINNKELIPYIDIVFRNLIVIFNANNNELANAISLNIPHDLFIIQNNQYKIKYNITVQPSLYGLTNPDLFTKSEDKNSPNICKAEVLSCLINYILTKYDALCARNNTLTYDELIQKVADSVEHSTQLVDKIFTKYPVAFIDEFQDTDALQWAIFSKIYHLGTAQRGNVVVVGDPKQAIYKFRGANIHTYINACDLINNKLELNSNFRSHPNIMNFVNKLFTLENQNSNINDSFLGNGINYIDIQAMKIPTNILPSAEDLGKIASKYKITKMFHDDQVHLVTITGQTKYLRTQQLLNSITFEILILLKADPTLIGKIAILVSKNKEATQLVQHLRKYGIKASELKLGSVFATSNAIELYNLLNSLNDINNNREFIKACSSNIFGIQLQALHADTATSKIMDDLRKRFFVYKQIWESSGLIALIYVVLNDNATRKIRLTNRDMANIWQLAELVNRHSERINNHTELLYWFKQKLNNANTTEDIDGNNEELIRLDNDEQQVKISTQHKSKGLEYEILFCPYFKSSSKLDKSSYKRPFFSNYQQDGQTYSELVLDENIGKTIVDNDNKEIHRLNYVALTRAKNRIYIYLKQPTYTAKGAYHHSNVPDKLDELFGYVKDHPQNMDHNLFNYPHFFMDNSYSAIKSPELFAGVCVYNRGEITPFELSKIQIHTDVTDNQLNKFKYVNQDFICRSSYKRQSYSALTRGNKVMEITDCFTQNEIKSTLNIKYRYSILNDKALKGAIFGVIFHELCENYPLNNNIVCHILEKYNILYNDNDYVNQLLVMIDEAFNYPVLYNNKLSTLHSCNGKNKNSINELKFNLTINNQISITNEITDLIIEHFGSSHPYAIACRSLNTIEAGFLVGFIDLFFETDGKYWVLDYKTNTLIDYNSSNTYDISNNYLIESMAEHHYYLQYLLYLVAVKRYLESRLQITDATDLIGGAVYYFVRGIYLESSNTNMAIVLDNKCQNLVRKIDLLFRK